MSYGVIREQFLKSLTTVSVPVADINVNNAERIGVEVNVTGDPLSSFTVQSAFYSPDTFNTLFDESAQYNNPTCPLHGTSGDLTTLTGDGWFILDTQGMGYVRLIMSSSGTSDVVVKVGG